MKIGSDSNRTGPFTALFLCVVAFWSQATGRTSHEKNSLPFGIIYGAARATCDLRRAATLVLLNTISLLTACQPSSEIHRFSGSVMGTTYHISVVATADQLPDNLGEQIQASLDHLARLMSTYKSDSELSLFNELPVGSKPAISPELAEVLAISSEVYVLSDGAFDPTVGPLVDVWGFGAEASTEQPPADELLAAVLSEVGFDAISLEGQTLRKSRQVRLDLSAVAKGYGADQVSELLSGQGLSNHLVEVGGEMRLNGLKPGGEKWRIGIERPQPERAGAQIAVAVTGAAVATSGDYRNYFERDGVRYSHTIDPRTGRPVTHRLASVTVITDNAAMADALATAFMVLGEQRSLEIAERRDIPLYMLVKSDSGFNALHSTAFSPYLTAP